MNGNGWVCDECGKTEVLQGPPQPFLAPDGWLLVSRSERVVGAAAEKWEFCSTECLHAQTAPTPKCDHCGRDHSIDDCPTVIGGEMFMGVAP